MARKKSKSIVPEPTLRRLPWYLAYVKMLQTEGETNVSSTLIAKGIGIDSALVAKDLSFISLTGKTRVGYEVDEMVLVLEQFLGFNQIKKAYIFGVGSLGAALIADRGLLHYGLDIVAGFDVSDKVVGKTITGVPVYHLDDLSSYSDSNVAVGVLTVPVDQAQAVSHKIVSEGKMRAIWNFTPSRIHVPAGIVVQNTSIYSHLAVMFYRMQMQIEEKKNEGILY